MADLQRFEGACVGAFQNGNKKGGVVKYLEAQR